MSRLVGGRRGVASGAARPHRRRAKLRPPVRRGGAVGGRAGGPRGGRSPHISPYLHHISRPRGGARTLFFQPALERRRVQPCSAVFSAVFSAVVSCLLLRRFPAVLSIRCTAPSSRPHVGVFSTQACGCRGDASARRVARAVASRLGSVRPRHGAVLPRGPARGRAGGARRSTRDRAEIESRSSRDRSRDCTTVRRRSTGCGSVSRRAGC